MSENESRSEGKVTDLMEALSVSLERAKADRRAPAPRADEGAEPSLHIVRVCELCACGAGGECHVPGCAFWMHDAPTGDTLAAIAGQAFEAMVCVNCAAPNPLCNEDIPCVAADGERFERHRWTAPAPRADEGAERPKPHLLHGVFDGDGLTRFRLECPYEVKGVLPTGRRCWSLDDDGEIDSLQCFAKGWVDECGAELISFEITDPSFPIEVDVELDGPLQTPSLTLHMLPASSGDGGAPTDPYDTLHMLDVFLALGGTDEEFAEWIDGRAFADAWPQLVAAVAGRIDSLRADSNPPAGVLLKIAERRPAPSPVPEEGPHRITWTVPAEATQEAHALVVTAVMDEILPVYLDAHGLDRPPEFRLSITDEGTEMTVTWDDPPTPEQGEGPAK